MSRFTKERRQEIVREFALRHNGQFNPGLFLDEVREKGVEHPAYEWFEWDRDKAAHAYQVEQARDFARDLRVSFKVEEIGRKGTILVREAPMPMVLSPIGGRRDGGGYVLVDPDDPAHMTEHCRQAALALRAWLTRYQAALIHVGRDPGVFAAAIESLGGVEQPQIAAE
ncbi:MAG: hypothetical protein K0S56_341 [Microvirga sp.]|jgi:hypothetical protein|nr:hypothetical protein [Microvirga sp.]